MSKRKSPQQSDPPRKRRKTKLDEIASLIQQVSGLEDALVSPGMHSTFNVEVAGEHQCIMCNVDHENTNNYYVKWNCCSGELTLKCYFSKTNGANEPKQKLIGKYHDGGYQHRSVTEEFTFKQSRNGFDVWELDEEKKTSKQAFHAATYFDHKGQEYVEPFEPRKNTKCMIIKAPMGTGKTHQLTNFLLARKSQYAEDGVKVRVLMICPQRSFGMEQVQLISKMDGFVDVVFYDSPGLDLGRREGISRISIQYESLHRLSLTNNFFHIVVLDEARSLMESMTNAETNHGHMRRNFESLKKFVSLADTTLIMGADINVDEAVPVFVKEMFPNSQHVEVHEYTQARLQRQLLLHFERTRWKALLFGEIGKDKSRVGVFCKSKATAFELATTIKIRFGEARKVILLTGDSHPDDIMAISKADSSWPDNNLVVLYTRVLSVGNSINSEFTAMFCDIRASQHCCTARQVMQSLLRFRSVTCATIHASAAGNPFEFSVVQKSSRKKQAEAWLREKISTSKKFADLASNEWWRWSQRVSPCGIVVTDFKLDVLGELAVLNRAERLKSQFQDLYDACSNSSIDVAVALDGSEHPYSFGTLEATKRREQRVVSAVDRIEETINAAVKREKEARKRSIQQTTHETVAKLTSLNSILQAKRDAISKRKSEGGSDIPLKMLSWIEEHIGHQEQLVGLQTLPPEELVAITTPRKTLMLQRLRMVLFENKQETENNDVMPLGESVHALIEAMGVTVQQIIQSKPHIKLENKESKTQCKALAEKVLSLMGCKSNFKNVMSKCAAVLRRCGFGVKMNWKSDVSMEVWIDPTLILICQHFQ